MGVTQSYRNQFSSGVQTGIYSGSSTKRGLEIMKASGQEGQINQGIRASGRSPTRTSLNVIAESDWGDICVCEIIL